MKIGAYLAASALAFLVGVGSASAQQANPGASGRASIDQTTPGTSNAVAAQGQVSSALQGFGAGYALVQLDFRGHVKVSEAGSNDPLVGVLPATAQAATSLQLNATSGNLYSSYAVLTAAASAQTYLVLLNVSSVPASGAAITPRDVAVFPSNAIGATATINYGSGPPVSYPAGTVAVITTSLTTYTPGAASFIQGRMR